MNSWKVEEHELPRWKYLTGKIDNPDQSKPLTYEETVEFLKIWEREHFLNDPGWINYVKDGLNRGDSLVLFK